VTVSNPEAKQCSQRQDGKLFRGNRDSGWETMAGCRLCALCSYTTELTSTGMINEPSENLLIRAVVCIHFVVSMHGVVVVYTGISEENYAHILCFAACADLITHSARCAVCSLRGMRV
jgi:hypothetical protein